MTEQYKPCDFELPDPTAEEIKARSAEIRKGWSKGVAARRQAWADLSWRPPFVMTIELVRHLNQEQE
jgi:hypothetical protein